MLLGHAQFFVTCLICFDCRNPDVRKRDIHEMFWLLVPNCFDYHKHFHIPEQNLQATINFDGYNMVRTSQHSVTATNYSEIYKPLWKTAIVAAVTNYHGCHKMLQPSRKTEVLASCPNCSKWLQKMQNVLSIKAVVYELLCILLLWCVLDPFAAC